MLFRSLSKYAAGRPKDIDFTHALVRHGLLGKKRLLALANHMPDRARRIGLSRACSTRATRVVSSSSSAAIGVLRTGLEPAGDGEL